MKIFAAIICIIGLVICLGAVGTMDHDAETDAETLTLGEFVLLSVIGLTLFVGGFGLYKCYDRNN